MVSRLLHRLWRPRRADGLRRRLFFAEREPWRREAELTCLNAGVVKEGPGIVRIAAIRGPGVCGAEYPSRCRCWARARRSATATICARPATSLRRPWRRAGPSCGRPSAPAPAATPARWQCPVRPVSTSHRRAPSVRRARAQKSYDFRRLRRTPSQPPRYRTPRLRLSARGLLAGAYERRPLVDDPAPARSVGVARARCASRRSRPSRASRDSCPRAQRGRPPPLPAWSRPRPARGRRCRSRSARRQRSPARWCRSSIVGSPAPYSRRRCAGSVHAGRRDHADLRLFLPRHERQSAREHFRARLRQCARHRRLHAR